MQQEAPNDIRDYWREVYRSAARLGLCLLSAMATGVAALWAWSAARPEVGAPKAGATAYAWVATLLMLPPLALIALWPLGKVGRVPAIATCLGCVVVAVGAGLLAH